MENFDFKVFKDKFIDDSNDLLNDLESALLELEKNTTNPELIDTVFRAMHTLKGVGSMYGYDEITNYTHLLETIYDSIRSQKCQLTDEIFQITFCSVDHLRMLLMDEKLENPSLKNAHLNLILQIEDIISKYSINKDAAKKGKPTIPTINQIQENPEKQVWNILFSCNESIIYRCINILYIFDDLAKLGELYIERKIENLNLEKDENEEIWSIYLITEKQKKDIEEAFIFVLDNVIIVKLSNEDIFDEGFQNKKIGLEGQDILSLTEGLAKDTDLDFDSILPSFPASNETMNELIQEKSFVEKHAEQRISVTSAKLDNLMYLVSELITLKSQMQLACDKNDISRWKSQVETLEKLSSQFRKNTISIRLVPLRELTTKFKRLIRDLSVQLDKKVNFVVQGDEIELDKNAVTALADPIMHLIRNCLDHGIEKPQNRLGKNKPETGTIKLSAYQSSNFIFIQIGDDGDGINHEKIRKKAIEKGIINENTVLTAQQIYDLIFLPGFSTAESLTNVSGRGVGMDVVKKGIAELRGEVIVESEAGMGTSFTIKLQQMLSIIDTLLIQLGSMFFLVPILEIEKCSQISNSDLETRRMTGTLQYKDELIPFISLQHLFNLTPGDYDKSKAIIIKKQDKHFAIIADTIIGQHQAVLKPIGDSFANQQYISSASMLSDGEVAYLLDTKLLQNSIKK